MHPASAPPLADAAPRRPSPEFTHALRPERAEMWPVALGSVPFDHVTLGQAIACIEAMIASGRPHRVALADARAVDQARDDAELRRSLVEADLVLCESDALVWASRWLGNALPARIPAAALAVAVLEAAVRGGHRLFLLGADARLAARAEANLQRAFPTLVLAGTHAFTLSGPAALEDEASVQRVRSARPDLLLVSLARPTQDVWIARHACSLGVPVTLGLSAALAWFAEGKLGVAAARSPVRLPRVFQAAHERPSLLERAKTCAHLWPVLRPPWPALGGFGRRTTAPHETLFPVAGWFSVEAGSHLTRRSLDAHAAFWRPLAARAAHAVVDLSRTGCVDATGLAFLLRWRRDLHARHRECVLLAPSAALRARLVTLRVADYFSFVDDVAQAVRHAEAVADAGPPLRPSTTRSFAWCGEIVAANADDVWRMATDHLQAFIASHATLVIVDLAQLRCVDDAGAAAMWQLKRWAQALRIEIIFSHPQPGVVRVLRLMQLDRLVLEGAQ